MTCGEALDWLHGTQLFGIKLGLENIRRLVSALDCDQPKARIIHVAGTNGKGSVCAMAEAMVRAAGVRTGLFTSPHLLRFNERIQIDGVPVSDDLIAAGITRIREIVENWEVAPTFFEIATALALRIFQDANVEVIILEVGMGGRLDSTNFIKPAISVITRIDLDHAQWLGPTLVDIAREKAGIIKENVPVITLPQNDMVLQVLKEVAAEEQAPFSMIDAPLKDEEIALAGSHQRWNAALAVAALKMAKIRFQMEALASVSWPGRFQQVGEDIVLDGAHNPAAAARLVQTWREIFGEKKPSIILCIVSDKDVEAVIRELVPLAKNFFTVPVRSPRSLSPEILGEKVRSFPGTNVQVTASLGEALEKAGRPVLVTGSLFLVGEALAFLEKATPPRPSQQ